MVRLPGSITRTFTQRSSKAISTQTVTKVQCNGGRCLSKLNIRWTWPHAPAKTAPLPQHTQAVINLRNLMHPMPDTQTCACFCLVGSTELHPHARTHARKHAHTHAQTHIDCTMVGCCILPPQTHPPASLCSPASSCVLQVPHTYQGRVLYAPTKQHTTHNPSPCAPSQTTHLRLLLACGVLPHAVHQGKLLWAPSKQHDRSQPHFALAHSCCLVPLPRIEVTARLTNPRHLWTPAAAAVAAKAAASASARCKTKHDGMGITQPICTVA
jgi:hypothetical protein